MCCNPAIGGIGKGHLVREIDALGRASWPAPPTPPGSSSGCSTPARARRCAPPAPRPTGSSTSGAMRGPWSAAGPRPVPAGGGRAAAGRGGRVAGVVTPDRAALPARAVVLTTGTFLRGRIHVGLRNHPRRPGRRAAGHRAWPARLRELGFRVGRLKTGTPPRIDGRTIDYSRAGGAAGRRPGAGVLLPGPPRRSPAQVPCCITYTNAATHEIIRAGLDRSPLYTGVIEGVGPRYCPSIEDKVVRFADKERHQIFLEPEGLDTSEIYLNGISTSLPVDVQHDLGAHDPGLGARPDHAARLRHRVRLLRPARPAPDAWKPSASPGSSSPARSTAPPATRRPPPRGCWPGSTPRCGARPRRPGARAATRPTSACWSTTWSPAAPTSPTACSPPAPSTGCCCARTTPTCA